MKPLLSQSVVCCVSALPGTYAGSGAYAYVRTASQTIRSKISFRISFNQYTIICSYFMFTMRFSENFQKTDKTSLEAQFCENQTKNNTTKNLKHFRRVLGKLSAIFLVTLIWMSTPQPFIGCIRNVRIGSFFNVQCNNALFKFFFVMLNHAQS